MPQETLQRTLIRFNPPPSTLMGVGKHQEVLQRTNIKTGGRPRKIVPTEAIKGMANKLGTRDIARELDTHPSMVSRVLSGKR